MQTGTITAAGRMLNMRLDIYPKGGNIDYVTLPNYRPSVNALSGLIDDPGAPAGDCDYNIVANGPNTGALMKPAQPYLGATEDGSETLLGDDTVPAPAPFPNSAHTPRHVPPAIPGDPFVPPIDHMGFPRDECAYLDVNGIPVVNADDVDGDNYGDHCIFAPDPNLGITAGEQVGSGIWDFNTFWEYHHPGGYRPANPFDCAGEVPKGCSLGNGANEVNVDLDPDYGDGNGRISRAAGAQGDPWRPGGGRTREPAAQAADHGLVRHRVL